MAHRLVELEVARGRARHALRLRRRGSTGRIGRGVLSTRLRCDLRRLVAQRAGHALHAFAAMRILARLLAAEDLNGRIEALACLLRDREVELRRYARADALGADDRAEQALDAAR